MRDIIRAATQGTANMTDATQQREQVLNSAADIFASPERAMLWLRTPLATFNGRTPEQLIKSGRAEELLVYLRVVASGVMG